MGRFFLIALLACSCGGSVSSATNCELDAAADVAAECSSSQFVVELCAERPPTVECVAAKSPGAWCCK